MFILPIRAFQELRARCEALLRRAGMRDAEELCVADQLVGLASNAPNPSTSDISETNVRYCRLLEQ